MSKILSRTILRNMFNIFCLAVIIMSALSLGSASVADGFIARITGTSVTKAATPPNVITVTASAITVSAATLNGNLTSLGEATMVNVSFEYGPDTSYGSTAEGVPPTIDGTGSFTADLTDLTPGQTYHFRAKAVGDGTAYGDDATFTTDTPPGVTTNGASVITTTSATLNGNLTSLGSGSSVLVSFEWGATTAYGNASADQIFTKKGNFTTVLINLNAETTYHFRAKAVGDGTTYGSDQTFTTLSSAPVVTTGAISNLTSTGATVSGSLTYKGSAASVTVSFEYGSDTGYGSTVTGTPSPLTSTGAFTADLPGLTPGQTYHFRAKAVGDGTFYGSDATFTTGTPSGVTTNGASDITATSATLNGNLTSLGTVTPVNVSFEYGLTTSYGSTAEGMPPALTGVGAFTADLTGLTPGQTYHFRAKAVGDGTSYGSDQTFKTLSPTPVVATGTVSNMTSTEATINGSLTYKGNASSVLVSFEYGTTTDYGSAAEGVPSALTGAGAFTANITGLTPGQTYHFRTKAVGDGTTYGDDATFTTGSTPPVVTTYAASAINVNSATLNGNLTSLGIVTPVNVSFEYGTTTDYGSTAEGVPSALTGAGAFTADLTGLTPGQTYHFRTKAVGDGTTYGDDATFTTGTPSGVTTNVASDITTTSATLNGNLTSLGIVTPVNVSFEYGLATSYGSTAEGMPSALTDVGAFTADLTGLTPGQTYHFRTKAVGDGTSYGSDQTFTTLSPNPVAITGTASNITSTGAALNGSLTYKGNASSVLVSFEYGTTTDYGSAAEDVPSALTSAGTFTADLTGLTPGQTYHFRAKAVGDGTAYGDDATFTTDVPQPPPASFTFTTFEISPLTAQVGDEVNISVTLANIGGSPGAYPITFKINGVTERTEAVSLNPGESQLVTFAVTRNESGTYEANINELTSSFVVENSVIPASESGSDWPLVAGIGGIITIVGMMVLFVFRPRTI